MICGDREWKDAAAIRRELSKLPPAIEVTIIHGGCRGADRLARDVAIGLGMEVIAFPANWPRYHRGAGHIRNQQMLVEGKPDLVLAFHSNIASSKGTADMIARAGRNGVPVRLFQS